MEANSQSEVREKLLKSLKATAHSIGHTRYFWETFTEKLIAGQIDGIDPVAHLKHHKSLDLICEDIHKILLPDVSYKTIDLDHRKIYLRIIQAVNDGLNY
jgi:hypothetical protein